MRRLCHCTCQKTMKKQAMNIARRFGYYPYFCRLKNIFFSSGVLTMAISLDSYTLPRSSFLAMIVWEWSACQAIVPAYISLRVAATKRRTNPPPQTSANVAPNLHATSVAPFGQPTKLPQHKREAFARNFARNFYSQASMFFCL